MIKIVNVLVSNLINKKKFNPLEVVDRDSETQL